MKSKLMLAVCTFVTVVSTTSFAAGPSVNCKDADKGVVTIISKTKRLAIVDAAKLAHSCLIKSNQLLSSATIKAVADASDDSSSACKLQKVKANLITNWVSGTLSVQGETGSESTLLMRNGVYCGPVGTGQFEGISASVNAKLSVLESYIVNMDTDKGVQTLTVTLDGIVNI